MDKEQIQNLDNDELDDDYAFVAVNKTKLNRYLDESKDLVCHSSAYLRTNIKMAIENLEAMLNCKMESEDSLTGAITLIVGARQVSRLIDNLKISIELLEDITK